MERAVGSGAVPEVDEVAFSRDLERFSALVGRARPIKRLLADALNVDEEGFAFLGAKAASTSRADTPPPPPPLLLALARMLPLLPFTLLLLPWVLRLEVDAERGLEVDRGVARPLLLLLLLIPARSWVDEEEVDARGGRVWALELGRDRCADTLPLLRFFEEDDASACSLDAFPYPALWLSSTESEVFGRRKRFAVLLWLLLPLLLPR